jgi:hypothetical protein
MTKYIDSIYIQGHDNTRPFIDTDKIYGLIIDKFMVKTYFRSPGLDHEEPPLIYTQTKRTIVECVS